MTTTIRNRFTPELLQGLRGALCGAVFLPGDEGYDAARSAWNLNAAHRPALVVMAENSDDVVIAVRFARRHALGVGVLATGHGTGTPCDDGLLINSSRMRDVLVDPLTRTALVSAGAVWQDVVDAAASHGLAGLPGSSTTVGVVGYTLGGGFGWLGRKYGLAAHSVTRAEVVTADGDIVIAGPDSHPDLFWGLQGGTGNLGIVTSLEFALHPVSQVYGGNLYYPLHRAGEVLSFYAAWSRKAPVELTASVAFRSFPPLPGIPEPLRGKTLIAVRGCFCGDVATGSSMIDQARAVLGPAAVDTFRAMPVAELTEISMDPVAPLGALSHAELIDDLTPEAVHALLTVAGPQSRSPLVMLELRQLGGALVGPPGALSPMAHTEARFSLNAIGITPIPEQAGAVRNHLAKVAAAMRPHTTGENYVNFLDLEGATPERIRSAYTAGDWTRLTRLKARYDPHNVFRFNRNVPGSTATESLSPSSSSSHEVPTLTKKVSTS